MKSYVQQRHQTDRFLFFFFMAEVFQPFCIWLLAKYAASEGHSHLWFLLVRGTEQTPWHVVPVRIKHLSPKMSRWKGRQTPFMQVHGRTTRARVQSIIYPVGQMHRGVTEVSGVSLKILANIKFDAILMLFFDILCLPLANFSFSLSTFLQHHLA